MDPSSSGAAVARFRLTRPASANEFVPLGDPTLGPRGRTPFATPTLGQGGWTPSREPPTPSGGLDPLRHDPTPSNEGVEPPCGNPPTLDRRVDPPLWQPLHRRSRGVQPLRSDPYRCSRGVQPLSEPDPLPFRSRVKLVGFRSGCNTRDSARCSRVARRCRVLACSKHCCRSACDRRLVHLSPCCALLLALARVIVWRIINCRRPAVPHRAGRRSGAPRRRLQAGLYVTRPFIN